MYVGVITTSGPGVIRTTATTAFNHSYGGGK